MKYIVKQILKTKCFFFKKITELIINYIFSTIHFIRILYVIKWCNRISSLIFYETITVLFFWSQNVVTDMQGCHSQEYTFVSLSHEGFWRMKEEVQNIISNRPCKKITQHTLRNWKYFIQISSSFRLQKYIYLKSVPLSYLLNFKYDI